MALKKRFPARPVPAFVQEKESGSNPPAAAAGAEKPE
jgi:hypothetical protein